MGYINKQKHINHIKIYTYKIKEKGEENMKEEIAKIKENSIKEMENCKDLKTLDEVRVK